MNFEVIIGIEIHCELKTKTKMFSGAPVSFGELPNTCTNEIDLAHPGTLPHVNKEAIAYALKTVAALNCKVDPVVRFDRKNYYYSDLPKGYQITQQFHPIGSDGYLMISTTDGEKKIRINRIHMEEDTAKQFHELAGTAIDFNRAGTPLIEIVSEPDIRTGQEAAAYVTALKEVLEYLDVSDAKMEEGSIRCDVNISLRPYGYDKFGAKVEVKNLNSTSNIQKSIEYEIARQSQVILSGGVIDQETRRFDEEKRATISMRKKEGAVDYKYFPEPNIPPIRLEESWINSVLKDMPELPSARKARYLELGLSEYDTNLLVANKALSDYFEEVLKHTQQVKLAANWMITEVLSVLNKTGKTLTEINLNPLHLAQMIEMIVGNEISSKQAKLVFEELLKGKDPKTVVKEQGMEQVSDTASILQMICEVLEEQPQAIEDYRNGKDRAVGFIVGQIMKKSKGQANPGITNKLVVEELKKRIG